MLDNRVNARSRTAFRRPLEVTATRDRGALLILALLALAVLPSAARADRVVVVEATGAGDEDQHEAVTDAVAAAVRGLSHDAVTEANGIDAPHQEVPEGANELRAVAEISRAGWVVVPILREINANGYWLTLRVGYVRDTRVEEIDAEVLRAHEGERLMALLQALLRPEGLGDDVAQLAGADQTGRDAAARAQAEAERLAREAEEQAARDQQTAAEREAAEAAERERTAFADRECYGVSEHMLFEVGVGVHPLLRAGSNGTGGTLGSVEGLFGYAIGETGLELRVGLQGIFGATTGIVVHGGAAYLASPFRKPFFLGAGVDLGVFAGISGSRVPALYVRAGALLVYHVTKALYLEAQLPEITVLSSNGGAVSLGLSVRAGTRF